MVPEDKKAFRPGLAYAYRYFRDLDAISSSKPRPIGTQAATRPADSALMQEAFLRLIDSLQRLHRQPTLNRGKQPLLQAMSACSADRSEFQDLPAPLWKPALRTEQSESISILIDSNLCVEIIGTEESEVYVTTCDVAQGFGAVTSHRDIDTLRLNVLDLDRSGSQVGTVRVQVPRNAALKVTVRRPDTPYFARHHVSVRGADVETLVAETGASVSIDGSCGLAIVTESAAASDSEVALLEGSKRLRMSPAGLWANVEGRSHHVSLTAPRNSPIMEHSI